MKVSLQMKSFKLKDKNCVTRLRFETRDNPLSSAINDFLIEWCKLVVRFKGDFPLRETF